MPPSFKIKSLIPQPFIAQFWTHWNCSVLINWTSFSLARCLFDIYLHLKIQLKFSIPQNGLFLICSRIIHFYLKSLLLQNKSLLFTKLFIKIWVTFTYFLLYPICYTKANLVISLVALLKYLSNPSTYLPSSSLPAPQSQIPLYIYLGTYKHLLIDFLILLLYLFNATHIHQVE